jgi:RNA polymerase sigma factor (sigma-70 family)
MKRIAEPPPDDLSAERRQFINLALQRARRSGRTYDERKVIALAKVDWQRRRAAERRRQRRTKRLDDLIEEPAIPNFLDAIVAAEEALRLADRLEGRQREVIHLLFIAQLSRQEVADELGIEPRTVTNTRTAALKTIRTRRK